MSAAPGPARTPVALTVAGSDPSGGAGIQADLKTFSANAVYGAAVLTALTAQNTRGVTGVHPVPAEFVRAQLDTLLDDVAVHAVKIGMLGGAAVAAVVADVLTERGTGPVVLDPVMVATSGDRLVDDDAVEVIRGRLLPLADLLTPNVPEAAVLLGTAPATDLDGLAFQACRLRDLGPAAAMVKGGHLRGPESVDVLATGAGVTVLRRPRVATANTHGTGCTLSSAIAALAAHALAAPPEADQGTRGRSRNSRPGAVEPHVLAWASIADAARDYLQHALLAGRDLRIGHEADDRDGRRLGPRHGPVHHFYAWWPAVPNNPRRTE